MLLFDPTNAKSSAYNPLLEVRRGEWEVRDVQNIADILVDPEGKLAKHYDDVDPDTHTDEVLADIKTLSEAWKSTL